MNYKTIQLTYESRVATITLNRPEKRNAISFELIDDLLGALKEVEQSNALVLILTGEGKAFSSGMDLENLKALIGRSPEQNLRDSETMVRLFRSLYEFPKVTIAAVNGPAIAGGTGLALLCDFTLAVPEAKFGYTEVRIGFVPAIVFPFSSCAKQGKNMPAIYRCYRQDYRRGGSGAHRLDQRNCRSGKTDAESSRTARRS